MTQELLYLSRAEVEAAGVNMTEIIELVEAAFREKAQGKVEMPPKPGIHPGGENFIHAMPAYIPGMRSAGIKWVSGFPENTQKGLPYITGLVILNDTETGLPLAVMDCVWITAKRTAAASAVAAKYLARKDSSSLGMLGCGVQARTHTEAMCALFPLKTLKAYDTTFAKAEVFASEMEARFGLDVEPVRTPQEAVSGLDMVVTAGTILKSPHATIQPGWLDAGTFASLVDFDSYWHRQALKEADKFCTDDVPQLEHYKSEGYFQNIPEVYADLGQLVSGKKPGREIDSERTLTCNLGLAMNDMAVAPAIFQHAKAKGLGTWLPL